MGFLSSIVGGALGAVGDVVGGLFGSKSSEKNAQTNADAALKAAELNTKFQKEFAQNGIRWRVDDAEKAGIHPLAALGANIPTYSPSFSMDAFNGNQRSTTSPLALGLKSLGQNIDRAKLAKQLDEDRAFDNAWKAAQIKRLEADTALAQAQASKMVVDSQQLPPGFPALGVNNHGQVLDGQPDSGLAGLNKLVQVNPSEAEANAPGKPNVSATSNPDLSFLRTDDGGFSPVRSTAATERLEDDVLSTLAWHWRNTRGALFDNQATAPPKSWLPKGYNFWRFNVDRWAWYPSKTKPSRKFDFSGFKWF